ncbi:hypothetical protein LGQ03_02070 [Loktanella sp. TSTF-M6]|uniref:Transferrin-binding protein B C-lobe/N-lobe beta barrel domain-containing protein n=1 Tax=Loktanella gaetbuli TaxID=2881335 RepID=A0ABS8BQL6_9RHOB|nr:hypothetical protein [Loktanella gaetbuli]MCB5198017.1 hypothetical protein [Loktanella gaetbuli]
MHRSLALIFCLTALAGCGGDSTEFADRFAIDQTTASAAADEAEDEAAPLVQQTDATRIVLVNGTPRPANRQFPQGTDASQLRSFSAPAGTFDPIDTSVPGSASYSGTYFADKIENIDNPDTTRWVFTKAEGPVVIDVDLDSGQISGRSSDNRLVIGRAARPINGGIVDGAVEFDGLVGPFNGTVTTSNIQADFAGENADTAVLGRFAATAP